MDDAAKKKGDGGEIPEQLSQLRGGVAGQRDGERKGWTDRQRRDMCGCHPAISHAQRERERGREKAREREREKGGGESSREAIGWGLEA